MLVSGVAGKELTAQERDWLQHPACAGVILFTRNFASKAQMFEGLIEFIEETLFGLINKITSEEKSGVKQLEAVGAMLLGFAQKNRGMTRVLIGDALVHENERLQLRINQLHDRVEATLKQALRFAAGQNEIEPLPDPSARANLMMSFIAGRWHQYAKSGFKRDPLPREPLPVHHVDGVLQMGPNLAKTRGMRKAAGLGFVGPPA